MAPGDTTRGRRLPVEHDADGRPSIPWKEMEPGDYFGPVKGWTGDLPAVFFLKPNARDADAPVAARSVQHICSPPHTFTEEDDGSLTVSPSISDKKRGGGSESDGWHGFLERGVWREV